MRIAAKEEKNLTAKAAKAAKAAKKLFRKPRARRQRQVRFREAFSEMPAPSNCCLEANFGA